MGAGRRAAANGCHETCVHHTLFTDLISRIEPVNAEGEFEFHERPGFEIGSGDRVEVQTWDALMVSLGTLGVISSVTFDCSPMRNAHMVDDRRNMAEALDDVKGIVEVF